MFWILLQLTFLMRPSSAFTLVENVFYLDCLSYAFTFKQLSLSKAAGEKLRTCIDLMQCHMKTYPLWLIDSDSKTVEREKRKSGCFDVLNNRIIKRLLKKRSYVECFSNFRDAFSKRVLYACEKNQCRVTEILLTSTTMFEKCLRTTLKLNKQKNFVAGFLMQDVILEL